VHRDDAFSDHVHDVPFNVDAGRHEPVMGFNYDSIRFDNELPESEESVSMSDMSSAVALDRGIFLQGLPFLSARLTENVFDPSDPWKRAAHLI
jgi:hypothetical protein